MSDAPLPSPDTAKPPIIWRSHGERVFVRVVCGACGARSQVIDVGPRFELGAEPNHGGVDIARRRIESGAFGLTLVKHHLDHASAVSALAAEAVIERMGLYSAHAAAREIGPFAVLLCETQTLVSALPHDVRLGGDRAALPRARSQSPRAGHELAPRDVGRGATHRSRVLRDAVVVVASSYARDVATSPRCVPWPVTTTTPTASTTRFRVSPRSLVTGVARRDA